MFVTAGFMIHKTRNPPKCPSMNEWVKNVWCIHTAEHYPDFKKKEILSLTTTWLNIGDIMLSEIGQAQKDKYCRKPLTDEI